MSIDLNKMIDKLRTQANPKSVGKCARYVADAMQAGGLTFPRQSSAYMYDTNNILKNLGYKKINTKDFQKGDIVVFSKGKGNHIHGHIQMYDGSRWISDFNQRSFHALVNYEGTSSIWRYPF